MATKWANRGCFKGHEAFRASANVEVSVTIRSGLPLQRFSKTPHALIVWQTDAGVVAYKINDFRRLARKIPHAAHHLLNSQRHGFRGSEEHTACHFVDGYSFTDDSDIAEDCNVSISETVQNPPS